MTRVLVLGGYGGFGARVSRRLAAAGHEVIVAGRSLARAAAFCADVPGTRPLAVDRDRPLADMLATERPAVLVDAAGPFQGLDDRVPRACLAAGVDYLDLADGRDFVAAFAALDRDARAAGRVLVTGASSVPALSGAVARRLAAGMDRVTAVEMAISASNRATAGPSVAAAILGQVGRPLRLWQGGRWTTAHGWQRIRAIRVGGRRRTVALADVPDLALLPDRLPGRPAVSFHAGTELGFQNRALWLASWPVRWGWLDSLAPAARWLRLLQRPTARLGSDVSGMEVRLWGTAGDRRLERCWHLTARGGVGPEIPALAVPLLVEAIAAGRIDPGARDAGTLLTLDDYRPAFTALALEEATEEAERPPALYARLLGPAFAELPSTVRAMHGVLRDGGAAGRGEVRRGDHPLARLAGWLLRMPPAGSYPLHVAFAERDGTETWTREFGPHRFRSTLSQQGGRLVERFGPLAFRFDLPADAHGLEMRFVGWRLGPVPLPRALAPRIAAREWEEDGRFRFDVAVALPLAGPVVAYHGWLHPC